jgi:hypothetical protein
MRLARSAGFQTCCIADFQIGGSWNVTEAAGLEARDTADLEVCATSKHLWNGNNLGWNGRGTW